MTEQNGWEKWSNYVLKNIERLDERLSKMEDKEVETKVEMTILKTKATIWGSIASFIVSLIISVIVGVLVYNITHGNIDKLYINQDKKIEQQSELKPDKYNPLVKSKENTDV